MQLIEVSAGLLDAVATAAPLEANATRIEYYATFLELSCELNFVRSGLGYCDLVVGSGEEVPYAQLINWMQSLGSGGLILVATTNMDEVEDIRVALAEEGAVPVLNAVMR